MFIERQSHRSSENYPELNWISWGATSGTKDYSGQK